MMTSNSIQEIRDNDRLDSSIRLRFNFSTIGRDFKEFESRKTIFQEMQEALHDDNIKVIGVCGMPGVGKTRLALEAVWRVMGEEDRLFDVGVRVLVSHHPHVSRMQKEIADMLGLSSSSGVEMAARIRETLKRKKVVIILDDIFHGSHYFEEIGIPISNLPKNSKIIFTSTSEQVCLLKKGQQIFQIKPLPQNEAFSLFLEKSHINEKADDCYRELADKISNKCMGLPILLIQVAKALRNKGLREWKDAYEDLWEWKDPLLMEVEELVPRQDLVNYMLNRMELSIDFKLKGQVMLMSLCAIFSEEIFLEQLVKLCLVWTYFKHGKTVEKARCTIIRGIHSLQASGWLQANGKIVVHELVQKAAMHIAFSAGKMFGVVQDEDEDGIEDTNKYGFTDILLIRKHRGELLKRLVCPNLQLLYVNDENQTREIPNNFFERINKGLQVISLNNMKLPSLPSSICVLTSIQTLCLEKCQLQDIALLGKLITLKVLSLSGSNIEQLPYQIGDLINLWLLDLDNCSKLESIPPNVISNLTRLQALLLPNSFSHWQHSEGSDNERTDASLGELSHLNDMKALQIHIPDMELVPRDFPGHKLERYSIFIGQVQGQWSGNFERKLQLKLGTNIGAYDWVKPLLAKSEELWLMELKGFESILELDHEGFQNLKHLHIQDIAEMEWLVNSKHPNPFPQLPQHLRQLKSLKIHSCPIAEVVHMNPEDETVKGEIVFPELHTLELVLLPTLKRLHTSNYNLQFPSMLNLIIVDCPRMVAIFTSGFLNEQSLPAIEGKSEEGLQGDKAAYSKLKNLKLKGLQTIEEIWQGSFFPGSFSELKEVEVKAFGKLKYLIPSNMLPMLKGLEKLTVKNCESITEVFQITEEFEIVSTMLSKPRIMKLISLPNLLRIIKNEYVGSGIFENLQTLVVKSCNSFRSLAFPFHGLHTLEELEISECKVLEEIIEIKDEDEILKKMLFTNLKSFVLESLPNLSTFCKEAFELPSVEEISIINCPKLKTFPIGLSTVTNHFITNQVVFPSLEKLNIRGLHSLTIIFNYHILNLQKLTSLVLFECDNLKYLFSSQAAKTLSLLQELRISTCKSVEEIVVAESGTETNKITLPRVKTLILENLPKLRSFCWDGCIVEWQSLIKVRVENCPKILRYALGIVDKYNLEVEVKECPWHKEDDPESSTEYLFITSDPFENQATLDIESSDHLRTLKMNLGPLSFSNLTVLSASKCDETLSNFLCWLIRRSRKLLHLEIKQCESLVEIFNLQNLVADERGDGKYFDQLKTIKLLDLPDLSCIWNKDPTGILGLHNLEEIEVVNCGFLKTIIPTSLAQHLRQLKVLKIHSCPTIEVVHMNPKDETGKREIVLPVLKTLELVLLKNLKRLHTPNYLFQFPSMESLIIEDCPTLDAFTGGFLNAQSLPAIEGKSEEELQGEKAAYTKMKNLKLKGLQTIEEIWQGSFLPGSFSELKEVEVKAFGKLEYLIPSNMLPMLKGLEKLTVKNCESITEVFQITEEFEIASTMLSKPRTMKLISLPNLLHIIKNEYVGSGIFENLQTLVIKSCNSFRSLAFPFNCLHTLEELEISECKVLKEIIVIKEEADILKKMLFTNLKSFVLESLPELLAFCLEAFELSSVEEISIINCPKLKSFSVELPNKENLSATINHFFTNQVSFEKPQKLRLANLEYPKSLCEPQEQELGQSSTSLLNGAQKLKRCTVRECEALELAFGIDDQIEELLPWLEELVLTDLPHMLLWRQEPTTSVFQNLIYLEFVRCSSLRTLFSISVAKNLQQLELLKLYQCEKMEHVLEGEAGSKKVLVFKKLNRIVLMHLPKLLSFCKEDCDFILLELEIVRVKDIPNMETFAKGTHQTPKLKEFYITYVSNCWQGSLNKTIEYLHNYPGAENAGHMKVEHTPLKPQTVTDSSEGVDSAVVPASFLEQEESNKEVAQENENLITEVPEEVVKLADCDSQTMSCSKEKVGASDIVAAADVVEEILEACERRPGFSPALSKVLRKELLLHPVLARPFREKSSLFAVMSYQLLANVLLVLEERNSSKMSYADFKASLKQLEELKILGFDHSWVNTLRDRLVY